MLLTTGAVMEFVKFMQILFWIILPALIIAVSITTFLHYRKRKRNSEEALALESSAPEVFNHHISNGEYILFDHSRLIGEYKKTITSNQAKYTALRHDFFKLESKYSALAQFAVSKINYFKNTRMDNNQDQLPQHIQEEINLLVQEHAAEKKEMTARMEQLARSYRSLEEENESLLEQIKAEQCTDEEKDSLVLKWKDENNKLKEKVAEQDYLKDILEEKKAQITFLQNQLEQRIVQYHQSEVQCRQLTGQMKELTENKYEEQDALQIKIKSLSEELEICQYELAEKRTLLSDKELLLAHTEEQWKASQAHCLQLEEKLLSNRQTLRRLYSELTACMETEEVPVIKLRAEYNTADEG